MYFNSNFDFIYVFKWKLTEDGQDGDVMVNAIGLADGERSIGLENALTQGPEMADATAVDVLNNIRRASWKIAKFISV